MNALRSEILNEDRVAVKGRRAIHPEHLTPLIVPASQVMSGIAASCDVSSGGRSAVVNLPQGNSSTPKKGPSDAS
jgi:hypothetical protein